MLISYLSNHLMMLLIPFVIWENYIGEKMLFSWVSCFTVSCCTFLLAAYLHLQHPHRLVSCLACYFLLVSLLSQQVKFSLMQHVETCSLMCSANGEKVWN